MRLLEYILTPVTRRNYALTGFSLMIVKYAIDVWVAWLIFNRTWSPKKYLIWPDNPINILDLAPADKEFALFMLAIAVPFIIIGTTMTYRRLLSAGLPGALLVLFFVPLINLGLIAILCLAPEKNLLAIPHNDSLDPSLPSNKVNPVGWNVIFKATILSALFTIITSVTLVFLSTNFLGNYGWGLFLGVPFAHGFFSVLIFGWKNPQSYSSCMSVGFYSSLLAFLAVFIVGIEGAICLIMFLPLGLPLALLGSVFGYLVQARPWLQSAYPLILLLHLPGLPLLMGMECLLQETPPLREVISVVEINSPPEKVWNQVIAFSEIPEANRHWLFLTGVAYPIRAEIEGTGVGAVRNCIFSTGPFVEPITCWDMPHKLSFDVISQPCPMKEWSFYNIHPPHLDHHLQSKKGEFRLIALPGNRTRLEGSTWYTNNMWPNGYWGLWSDTIIHTIHLRVLDHIKAQSEL